MWSAASSQPEPFQRLRLFIGISAALTCLAIWGASLYTLRAEQMDLELSVRQDSSNFTRLLLEQIEQVISSVEGRLLQLDAQIREAPQSLKDRAHLSQQLRLSNPGLHGLMFNFVLSPDGSLLAVSDPRLFTAADLNFSVLALRHRQQIDQGLQLSTVNESLGAAFHFIPLSRSVRDAQGRLIAIVGMALDPDYFRLFFKELADEGGLHISVRLMSGQALLRYPFQRESTEKTKLSHEVREAVQNDETGYLVARAPEGTGDAFYFFRRSEDYPYFVLTARNMDRIYAGWRETVVIQMWLTVLTSVALGFLCWFALRKLRQVEQQEKEIQQLVEHSRKTSRLEAIGRLAGGIARDFNSILMVMFGQLEWMERKSADSEAARVALSKMKNALTRARELVRQVLAFSRLNPGPREEFDLGALAEELGVFMRAGLPPGIDLRVKAQTGLTMSGDSTQIYQVILNLCSNAVDAMKATGGTLSLEARRLESGELELSVSDTGPGISDELKTKVFESFFTTKPKGEGTGIGLSMVQDIVQEHQGTVEIQSPPEGGTRVRVQWPDDRNLNRDSRVANGEAGGARSYLFVDDEEAVVTLVRDYFAASSSPCLCVTDPARALEELQKDPRRFRLFIVKKNLRPANGESLIADARLLSPGLPAILTVENENSEGIRRQGDVVILPKPYGFSDLALAIRMAEPLSENERGGRRV